MFRKLSESRESKLKRSILKTDTNRTSNNQIMSHPPSFTGVSLKTMSENHVTLHNGVFTSERLSVDWLKQNKNARLGKHNLLRLGSAESWYFRQGHISMVGWEPWGPKKVVRGRPLRETSEKRKRKIGWGKGLNEGNVRGVAGGFRSLSLFPFALVFRSSRFFLCGRAWLTRQMW